MSQKKLFGRRRFLAQAVAATIATATASTNGLTAMANDRNSSTRESTQIQSLNLKTVAAAKFQSAVGQVIKVSASQSRFVLDAVQTFSDANSQKRPKNIRKESFSLLLSAPAGIHLQDGIYTLSHAKVGKFEVFLNEVRLPSTFSSISPLGQAEQYLKSVAANMQPPVPKVYYQVVFN